MYKDLFDKMDRWMFKFFAKTHKKTTLKRVVYIL